MNSIIFKYKTFVWEDYEMGSYTIANVVLKL